VLDEKRSGNEKKFRFPKKCPVCHTKVAKEENEVAGERKTGQFGYARDKRHIAGKEKHENRRAQPEKGVFESHFLTANKIDDKQQNSGGYND